MSHDHGLINFSDQQFAAHILLERGIVGLEETAFAGEGFDDSLIFKLRVGFGDGVPVYAQLLREGPDGRQGFTCLQRARGGRGFNLVHHLKVNRFASLKIDLQEHIAVTVI